MTGPAGPVSAYPRDVARVLSYLANLIESSVQLRGVGTGVREFASAFLGVPATETVVTANHFGGLLSFQLTALALAADMHAHPPRTVIGDDQEEPPRWERLDLGEESMRYPLRLAAAFGAGSVAPSALVVAVGEDLHEDGFTLTAYSRAEDATVARGYVDGLVARGRAATNPFRGRTVEVVFARGVGMSFRAVTLEPVTREDVVLPERVWEEVDRNVHGLFAGADRLARAGLARNRGIMLAGPPGTGKTVLCRVLASEVGERVHNAPGVTVVLCDAHAVASSVRSLYRELEHLAPALVVMEDVDLVVGHRLRGGGTSALMDFLLALDGAMSRHAGVVTIATTNDLSAIDDAAKRAARFDRVIEVPAPDRTGRATILRRYLRAVDCDVDADRVATATDGMTGADLRELVSLAVLHVVEAERRGLSEAVTTDLLVRLTRDRSSPTPAFGAYL